MKKKEEFFFLFLLLIPIMQLVSFHHKPLFLLMAFGVAVLWRGFLTSIYQRPLLF